MAHIFDALDYVKGAEAIGIKREHAEYVAHELSKLIEENIATPKDLKNLEDSMKSDLLLLEERLLNKITVRFGYLIAACSGLIIAALKIHI